MTHKMKATSKEIIDAYKATGSVWEAAKMLGMSGQSVHERLIKLGIARTGSHAWSKAEDDELRKLAGVVPILEISQRLGRTYSGVAGRLSKLNIRSRPKAKARGFRGTGFTKSTMVKYASDLLSFDGRVTVFCRQRGLNVDVFVKAMQKYEPDAWKEYSKSYEMGVKMCEYCSTEFYPTSTRQRTCCRKCQSDLQSDRQCFNGNKRNTVGLIEGMCQLCGEHKTSKMASHHVYGRDNDPEAEHLVALCNGCHNLVEKLAARKAIDQHDFCERAIIWALMKRNGKRKPAGYYVEVIIEELAQDDLDEDEPEDVQPECALV